MKKLFYLLALCLALSVTPSHAAPHGGGHHGGGGIHHGGGIARPVHLGHAPTIAGGHHHHVRPLPPPPMYRYRPIYRPYPIYYPSYYPTTYYTASYTYYPTVQYATPAVPSSTVVVEDPYAGINTTANVINAAANVAATIKYLTW